MQIHDHGGGVGVLDQPRRARRPKPKRRLPPEVLTPDEARALLDACGSYTPIGLRNRAMIALLYRAVSRLRGSAQP